MHIVYGRMKHPYSIYRKMFNQNKSLDEIFDLFAFRVIVDDGGGLLQRSGCHPRSLQAHSGPLQGLYRHPKAQRIPVPPHHGHRPRTACPSRCRSAPRRCTRSPSTAWPPTGSTSRDGQGSRAPKGATSGSARLLENQEGADAEDYIHSLKVDMFADEVFVFTPGGDVQNLPAGATPIDFAYAIHSAVGNRMVGAKVNGRIVTLGPSC